MNKFRFRKESIFSYTVFFLIALIYLTHAPRTVQTGDSGELTAAAFRLLVAHPPGYPFWIWINHFWIKFVSFGTAFFSFSVLNILISMATLWILGTFIKSTPVKLLGVLSLGLGALFWRYAEIPEVFALHILLSALTIWAGASERKIPGTQISIASGLMPLFFSLGIAHHQTIIFLLPFVIWVCWKQRKDRYLYISITGGFLICTGLYMSMLAMHPQHMYSWGNLQGARDVWDHFLRKEYGTFSLQHKAHEDALPLQMRLFIIDLFQSTWALLLLAAFTIYKCIKSKEKFRWQPYQLPLSVSLAAYVFVFIPMMQTAPINFFAEVSQRFFILPIFLVVLLLGSFLGNNLNVKIKTHLGFIALVGLMFSVQSYNDSSRFNDFSDNTIVEDYAINILNIVSEFKNPILFSSMDTEFFSIRYVQLVEDVQPNVLVLLRSFFASTWFTEKGLPQIPNFKFSAEEAKKKNLQVTLDDVIIPNLDNYTFITTDDEYPPEAAKITYLPLGFLISKGSGIDFYKTKYTPQFRSDLSIIDTSPYFFNSYRGIFSRYTYYFAAQGQAAVKNGNDREAIDSFERILGIAPYTFQALDNLCKLKEKLKIEDSKCSYKEQFRDYFDYYRYHNTKYYQSHSVDVPAEE